MRIESMLGHFLMKQARKNLAAKGVEIKGCYTVIPFHGGENVPIKFHVDCTTEHLLTQEEVVFETELLHKELGEIQNDIINE